MSSTVLVSNNMGNDNDIRGWILITLSALACTLGACFICIDIIVRLIPGRANWRTQESNTFLSCSLSLSAGVMLFSSLYKLLPEAKSMLISGNLSARKAAWTLILSFLLGIWGIQIISRVMRFLLPSHVIKCENGQDNKYHDIEIQSNKVESPTYCRSPSNRRQVLERTPLLTIPDEANSSSCSGETTADQRRVPEKSTSFHIQIARRMTHLVTGGVSSCEERGLCRGYTNPCMQDFLTATTPGTENKNVSQEHSDAVRSTPTQSAGSSDQIGVDWSSSGSAHNPEPPSSAIINKADTYAHSGSPETPAAPSGPSHIFPNSQPMNHSPGARIASHDHAQHNHHHHVPKNAFLNLSFQTSVGLVLHKLPEGFITYASNHANPNLGFSIFMALAIHNITEGFALALPIYLATNSRWRALLYSCILGGLSQPLGAAIAAAWFAVAENGKADFTPNERVYGSMFAATAGILATVAINLLSQGLERGQNKDSCIFFVFVGMGILGVSSALIAT